MYTQVYDIDETSVITLPRFAWKWRLIMTYIYENEDIPPTQLTDPYKNPTVFIANNREESKVFLDSLKS